MSQSTLSVLAIAGSLRKASFNRMALEVAKGLAPDGMSITIFEGLGDIPLYNEDLRGGDDPAAAVALADAVRAADAVLIGTYQTVRLVATTSVTFVGELVEDAALVESV